jgi:hypothetical protein
MKQFQAVLLIAVSIPTIFAQQPSRRGHPATPWQPAGKEVGSVKFSSRKMLKPHATVTKDAVAPAAGVVQIHYEEGRVFAFFVATGQIPSGSQQMVSITLDNGAGDPTSIVFDPVSYSFNPGDYITLPSLDNMTDLQPSLLVTYTVDVTTARNTTEANGYFLTGASLGFDNLTDFAPLISGTSQKIAGNKDMILVIDGVFTTDAPLVAIEGSVPPASAITRVSTSEIDVNLSQVAGLDLTGLNEYLLTVSQAGFADTVVYRYVPAATGTFNPAPSQ